VGLSVSVDLQFDQNTDLPELSPPIGYQRMNSAWSIEVKSGFLSPKYM